MCGETKVNLVLPDRPSPDLLHKHHDQGRWGCAVLADKFTCAVQEKGG